MQPEGVIKFEAIWRRTPPMPMGQLSELMRWRQVMYEVGLIGKDEQGLGYGNISQRVERGTSFLISGSGTGVLPQTGPEHFCLVERVELERNRLWCSGPVVASSESMSHAAVYQGWDSVAGVVHVHHADLWLRLIHHYPTTDPNAAYGSVAMAKSLLELMETSETRASKLIVMAGHPNGLIAFGESLAQACRVLLDLLED